MNTVIKKIFPSHEKTEGSTAMAIFVAGFAGFGGILYGYDTGTISGVLAMPYVLKNFPENGFSFTSNESSLITSILSAGTFIGAILSPFVSDNLGRRIGIMIACIIFILGCALQTASSSIPLLCAGRAIAGAGVGVISATVPLYQSEAAPKWIRGAIVCAYQLTITIGLLLAAIVNNALKDKENSSSYRVPLAIQIVWAIILIIGMLFLPETPRFWVRKNQINKAAKSLSILRKLPEDHPALVKELSEIKANHEYESSFGEGSYLDCFRGGSRQQLKIFTGMGLQALSQLTGINFIFYYGTNFFKSSGIENPFTIQLITNIVNVLMTIPGIVFVELSGRRSLLMVGAIGMCLSDFIVATVGVTVNSLVSNKVLIAFVCTFIGSFAASWGPVGWVVVGEIYPLRVRGKSVALCIATNWLFNFAIAFATPYLVDSGPGNANLGVKVFFIWGACNALGIIFVYFFIYETKGLTLEQVDELYENVSTAHGSRNFTPSEGGFYHENEKHSENIHVEEVNSQSV
ncbi:general substrate transporter [Nadsonia fulvescens var. elongata DSM 6958]|uniref:General substrate transporter n=1 Tax=Nadsonia fulvescens var. elongata DSM 6958 TaxID=857566 RepID=A0A1E3PR23_9ASCO|nr:general substrate transporter [Nadsonia fulvescens var. elongata DSM 6958]